MNPKKISENLKIFIVIFVTAFLVIIIMETGLATTIKNASVDLSGFLPIILKKPYHQTQISSGVLIVYSSQVTTDGNAGGRTGMDNICVSEDPESHLCSLIEIETAWTNQGVRFQSPFIRAWVDNPQYDVRTWKPASCVGWTSNSAIFDKGTWIDDNGSNVHTPDDNGPWCNEVHSVACCKSAP